MGGPAGWRPDPLMLHRVRYWDGVAWTDQVADGVASFTDPVQQRRFFSEVQIVLGPVVLAVWSYVEYYAVDGPMSAALLVGVPGSLFALMVLMTPYVATLDLDGTLTFRAVSRTATTRVDAVVRIGYTPMQGLAWKFDFGTGRASLGSFGGERLAAVLVRHRPELARTSSSWHGW